MSTIATLTAAAVEAARLQAAAAEAARVTQEAAAAAAKAEYDAQYRLEVIATCRQALGAMVGDALDVASLRVEHVDLEEAMVVLADDTGAMAVYDNGRVQLVALHDGEWAVRSPVVWTLVELGAALGKAG